MVLAFDHVAKTGKERFHHVCVLAAVAVDFGVVHAVNHPTVVQRVPVGRLVGRHGGGAGYVLNRQLDTLPLAEGNKWQRAACALTHGNHNAAGACLMLLKATINALGFLIVRANVTAEIRAVDFNVTVKNFASVDLCAIASRSLWARTNAVLYWQSISRLSCTMLIPLEAFTIRQIAASRSTKSILRDAKIVPDVTLNWCAHALHLNLRRVVIL